MTTRIRNNVNVSGEGATTIFFAHGYGCDQNMWRLLQPTYGKRYRMVVFDLVGSGASDLSAYDPDKYNSLHGYAQDVLEIVKEFGNGPAIFVGHSVSAMIGMLADLQEPGLFAAQIMVGPSPCYINDGDYCGGFEKADIESLLETLESNYLGWASNMAPAIMGAPEQPELGAELTNSFCRTDPDVARQFARVTFLSDHRAELPKLTTPTLILQCSDDIIAPLSVGHDLRNPLSTIDMATTLLARGDISHPQRRILDRMKRATDRADRLISDLLDFTQARIGAGLSVTLNRIDLHGVIAEAIDELSLAHPTRQLVHIQQGNGLCLCRRGPSLPISWQSGIERCGLRGP